MSSLSVEDFGSNSSTVIAVSGWWITGRPIGGRAAQTGSSAANPSREMFDHRARRLFWIHSVRDAEISIKPEDFYKTSGQVEPVDSPLTRLLEGARLGLSPTKQLAAPMYARVWIECDVLPAVGMTLYVPIPDAQ